MIVSNQMCMGRKKESHLVVSTMPKRDPCQDSESPHRNIKTRKNRNSLKTEEKKTRILLLLFICWCYPPQLFLKGQYHILFCSSNITFWMAMYCFDNFGQEICQILSIGNAAVLPFQVPCCATIQGPCVKSIGFIDPSDKKEPHCHPK